MSITKQKICHIMPRASKQQLQHQLQQQKQQQTQLRNLFLSKSKLYHPPKQLTATTVSATIHSTRHRFLYFSATPFATLTLICLVINLITLPFSYGVGYSYTRFTGPVSGPEQKVYINDHAGNDNSNNKDIGNKKLRMDYTAKPEYEFAYGVEDAAAHILHNRNEMRNGDAVKGVYSVVDPDGTLRVVKYTADNVNGFQAEVILNGVSSLHGGQPKRSQAINQYGTPSSIYSPQQVTLAPPTPITTESTHIADYHKFQQNFQQNFQPPIMPDYFQNTNLNNYYKYQPQYEVREDPKEKDNNDKKQVDYDDDDDDDDEDDDGDEDEDEDDSDDKESAEDALEDYDESVKSNEASNESDDYY